MYLYINGSIVKSSEAAISPFDHGFLYGLGLFETFRTYDGHPFLLDDHFQRLHESAEEMGIVLPTYKREEVVESITKLLDANDLVDGYFRWNITAGERGVGLSTDAYTSPNVIVYVKPLPDTGVPEKRGVILAQRRNTPEGKYRLKSHHYLNNILGKREAGADPAIEGIFLSEDGYLSEGVVSNLFWFNGGTLFTPSINTGALNGITRQFVLMIAKQLGYSVKEGPFPPEDLLKGEEVFVTNSIQEIVPLFQVDDVVFPGMDGPLVEKIHQFYKKNTSGFWSKSELLKGE